MRPWLRHIQSLPIECNVVMRSALLELLRPRAEFRSSVNDGTFFRESRRDRGVLVHDGGRSVQRRGVGLRTLALELQ